MPKASLAARARSGACWGSPGPYVSRSPIDDERGWQYYARLLDQVQPLEDEDALVARATHLVVVAEIITRWPAHQTAFRRRHPPSTTSRFAATDSPPERGLHLLADAAPDDVRWSRAEAAILDCPVDGLRDLLRAYDGPTIAALYASLT